MGQNAGPVFKQGESVERGQSRSPHLGDLGNSETTMPPAFVRASSVAEQEAYKRQEQNNQKLCEESEQGNLEVVDQLLKQGWAARICRS